ncbi:hypothetical protein D9757_011748 [Collybiopsis confluens]|uniref:AB hydrolase-1 domain-containing protein n=1 Tax=Collybiopsis confluens TaxID=2823264 RepID=A0A8H5G848_9AGAR|nr:hypothetical protein D9757_011748 [Collybiopsis confluens]
MSEIQGSITFTSPSLPPNKPCQTFYKIINGPLSGNGDTTPLIALHGGPGATHDYLLILADLGVPLIVYDQIGSGKSTHYTEKMGDTSFWTVQLFLDELDNLIRTLGVQDKYDLAGHSWGGMLAASHACLFRAFGDFTYNPSLGSYFSENQSRFIDADAFIQDRALIIYETSSLPELYTVRLVWSRLRAEPARGRMEASASIVGSTGTELREKTEGPSTSKCSPTPANGPRIPCSVFQRLASVRDESSWADRAWTYQHLGLCGCTDEGLAQGQGRATLVGARGMSLAIPPSTVP